MVSVGCLIWVILLTIADVPFIRGQIQSRPHNVKRPPEFPSFSNITRGNLGRFPEVRLKGLCRDGWNRGTIKDLSGKEIPICLKLNPENLTWTEAQTSCRNDYGFLLKLESQAKSKHVDLFSQVFSEGITKVWTGMHTQHNHLVWDDLIPNQVRPLNTNTHRASFPIRPWRWQDGTMSKRSEYCGQLSLDDDDDDRRRRKRSPDNEESSDGYAGFDLSSLRSRLFPNHEQPEHLSNPHNYPVSSAFQSMLSRTQFSDHLPELPTSNLGILSDHQIPGSGISDSNLQKGGLATVSPNFEMPSNSDSDSDKDSSSSSSSDSTSNTQDTNSANNAMFDNSGNVQNTNSENNAMFDNSGTVQDSNLVNNAMFDNSGNVQNTNSENNAMFDNSGTVQDTNANNALFENNNPSSQLELLNSVREAAARVHADQSGHDPSKDILQNPSPAEALEMLRDRIKENKDAFSAANFGTNANSNGLLGSVNEQFADQSHTLQTTMPPLSGFIADKLKTGDEKDSVLATVDTTVPTIAPQDTGTSDNINGDKSMFDGASGFSDMFNTKSDDSTKTSSDSVDNNKKDGIANDLPVPVLPQTELNNDESIFKSISDMFNAKSDDSTKTSSDSVDNNKIGKDGIANDLPVPLLPQTELNNDESIFKSISDMFNTKSDDSTKTSSDSVDNNKIGKDSMANDLPVPLLPQIELTNDESIFKSISDMFNTKSDDSANLLSESIDSSKIGKDNGQNDSPEPVLPHTDLSNGGISHSSLSDMFSIQPDDSTKPLSESSDDSKNRKESITNSLLEPLLPLADFNTGDNNDKSSSDGISSDQETLVFDQPAYYQNIDMKDDISTVKIPDQNPDISSDILQSNDNVIPQRPPSLLQDEISDNLQGQNIFADDITKDTVQNDDSNKDSKPESDATTADNSNSLPNPVNIFGNIEEDGLSFGKSQRDLDENSKQTSFSLENPISHLNPIFADVTKEQPAPSDIVDINSMPGFLVNKLNEDNLNIMQVEGNDFDPSSHDQSDKTLDETVAKETVSENVHQGFIQDDQVTSLHDKILEETPNTDEWDKIAPRETTLYQTSTMSAIIPDYMKEDHPIHKAEDANEDMNTLNGDTVVDKDKLIDDPPNIFGNGFDVTNPFTLETGLKENDDINTAEPADIGIGSEISDDKNKHDDLTFTGGIPLPIGETDVGEHTDNKMSFDNVETTADDAEKHNQLPSLSIPDLPATEEDEHDIQSDNEDNNNTTMGGFIDDINEHSLGGFLPDTFKVFDNHTDGHDENSKTEKHDGMETLMDKLEDTPFNTPSDDNGFDKSADDTLLSELLSNGGDNDLGDKDTVPQKVSDDNDFRDILEDTVPQNVNELFGDGFIHDTDDVTDGVSDIEHKTPLDGLTHVHPLNISSIKEADEVDINQSDDDIEENPTDSDNVSSSDIAETLTDYLLKTEVVTPNSVILNTDDADKHDDHEDDHNDFDDVINNSSGIYLNSDDKIAESDDGRDDERENKTIYSNDDNPWLKAVSTHDDANDDSGVFGHIDDDMMTNTENKLDHFSLNHETNVNDDTEDNDTHKRTESEDGFKGMSNDDVDLEHDVVNWRTTTELPDDTPDIGEFFDENSSDIKSVFDSFDDNLRRDLDQSEDDLDDASTTNADRFDDLKTTTMPTAVHIESEIDDTMLGGDNDNDDDDVSDGKKTNDQEMVSFMNKDDKEQEEGILTEKEDSNIEADDVTTPKQPIWNSDDVPFINDNEVERDHENDELERLRSNSDKSETNHALAEFVTEMDDQDPLMPIIKKKEMELTSCNVKLPSLCFSYEVEVMSTASTCDNGWYGHVLLDSCFKILDGEMGYNQAVSMCKALKSRLVLAGSQFERDFVLIAVAKDGKLFRGEKFWMESPSDRFNCKYFDERGTGIQPDCHRKLHAVCVRDAKALTVYTSDNVPYNGGSIPDQRDVTRVFPSWRRDNILQCELTSAASEFPVLWFHNGVLVETKDKYISPDLSLHLNARLVDAVSTVTGRQIRLPVLQGKYWCEVWDRKSLTRRMSSVYDVRFSDVLSFYGSMQLGPVEYRDQVLFNMIGEKFTRVSAIEMDLQKVFSDAVPLLKVTIPDLLYSFTFVDHIRSRPSVLEYHTYFVLSRNYTVLDEDMLYNRLKGVLRAKLGYKKYMSQLPGQTPLSIFRTMSLQSTVSCPAATLQTDRDIYDNKIPVKVLAFPKALMGEFANSIDTCSLTSTLPAGTARCMGDFYTGAYWGEVIADECRQEEQIDSFNNEIWGVSPFTEKLSEIAQTSVDQTNVQTVVSEVAQIAQVAAKFTPTDINKIADVLDHSTQVTNLDAQVGTNVLKTIDKLMAVSDREVHVANVETKAANRIIKSLERFAEHADLGKEDKMRMVSDNVVVEIWNLNPGMAPVIGLAAQSRQNQAEAPFTTENIATVYNKSQLVDANVDAAIELPPEVFVQKEKGESISNRLTMMVFRKSKLFEAAVSNDGRKMSPTEQQLANLNSYVISASIAGKSLSGLKERIKTIFRPLTDRDGSKSCVWWDFDMNHRKGGWSNAGCYYDGRINGRDVCLCDHLTNFAVLLDFYGQGKPISDAHELSLSIITVIGLSFSIIGLALTIISYIFFRKLRHGRAQQTLFNLSLALLCSMLVFLVGIKQTHHYGGCIAVAVMLHYFIVVSFMWMLIEAVLQYLTFVKILGTYITRFTLKTVLPAWGLPLVPVIAVLSIDPDLYKGGPNYCWMGLSAFYYAFVIPISGIILINLVIFIITVVSIFRRGKGLRSNQKKQKIAITNLQATITSFVLLGLTWVFGYLAVSDARLTFQYVFTILNSLQGFFIFVLFVLRKKKVRDQWYIICCKGGEKDRVSRSLSASNSSSYSNGSNRGKRERERSDSTKTTQSTFSNSSSFSFNNNSFTNYGYEHNYDLPYKRSDRRTFRKF